MQHTQARIRELIRSNYLLCCKSPVGIHAQVTGELPGLCSAIKDWSLKERIHEVGKFVNSHSSSSNFPVYSLEASLLAATNSCRLLESFSGIEWIVQLGL